MEDSVQDGNYVLRAELPGLDQEKDVEVSVEDRMLTIHAERHDEHKEPHAMIGRRLIMVQAAAKT